MTTGIRSDASGTFGALTFGGDDVLRFGSDNSGQLAGFRNILINGDMRINQRGVTIAAAANGTYGPDRWKKVDASNMTQIVEAGNFEPSTVYTLSGTGVTTQQLTSPASGNWTLPNIPIAATKIQLEKGTIATPFELRPVGLELALCQRYAIVYDGTGGVSPVASGVMSTATLFSGGSGLDMRASPTLVVLSGTIEVRTASSGAATSVVVTKTGGSLTVSCTTPTLTAGQGAYLRANNGKTILSAEL